MSRLFWFSAGIAAGVALHRKVNETARKAMPSGVAEQLGGAVRELAGAVGSFGADVRSGMSEREHELHNVVEHGAEGGPRDGTNGDAAAQARRARRAVR